MWLRGRAHTPHMEVVVLDAAVLNSVLDPGLFTACLSSCLPFFLSFYKYIQATNPLKENKNLPTVIFPVYLEIYFNFSNSGNSQALYFIMFWVESRVNVY